MKRLIPIMLAPITLALASSASALGSAGPGTQVCLKWTELPGDSMSVLVNGSGVAKPYTLDVTPESEDTIGIFYNDKPYSITLKLSQAARKRSLLSATVEVRGASLTSSTTGNELMLTLMELKTLAGPNLTITRGGCGR